MITACRRRPLLSLAQCRQLLGIQLEDSEVRQLREELYSLAEVAIDGASARATGDADSRGSLGVGHVERGPGWTASLRLMSPADREQAIERAAIAEFDGQLSRERAQSLALRSVQSERAITRTIPAHARAGQPSDVIR